MVDLRANLEIFVAVCVLGFSLLQAIVAAVSFNRLRTMRLALVGLGFAAFALKGAYLVQESWTSRGTEPWVLVVGSLDLAILLFLYLAVRAR